MLPSLFGSISTCGQSYIFHSRVENNEKVSKSLGKAVEKALGR